MLKLNVSIGHTSGAELVMASLACLCIGGMRNFLKSFPREVSYLQLFLHNFRACYVNVRGFAAVLLGYANSHYGGSKSGLSFVIS